MKSKFLTTIIFTLLLIFLFPLQCRGAGENRKPQKRALLVGINEYENFPQYNLRGCENDTRLMKYLLMNRFGFEEDNIRVLKDNSATLENIRKNFKEFLIKDVKPEDTVLFYYSGHGTRIKDANGDERDGYDEALCPTDAGGLDDGNNRNLLIDDELGELLEQIPSENLVVIMDCCFSGTATKDFSLEGKNRFLEMDKGNLYDDPALFRGPPIDENPMKEGIPVDKDPSSPKGSLGSFPWIFMSGSSSFEKARESLIEIEPRNMPCGLFTRCLYGSLYENPNQNYRELLGQIKKSVRVSNPSQTPQLEGKYQDRLFCKTITGEGKNLSDDTGKNIVSIEENRQVGLNFGSVQGAVKGSLYEIIDREGNSVGELTILSSEAFTSRGVVVKADKPIEKGLSVREIVRKYRRESLKVLITKEAQKQDLIKDKTESIPYIKIIDEHGLADRIIDGSPQGNILIYSGDGTLLRSFTQKELPASLPEIEKLFESAYVMKRLSELHNPRSDFNVRIDTDSPDNVYKVGDSVAFRFRADEDCYLLLLHVSSDGNMTVIFPNDYSMGNFVKKNQEYTIPPFSDGQFLFDFQLEGPPGQEMVKAIATRKYLDPWELENNGQQEVLRSLRGSSADEVEKLFDSLNRILMPGETATKELDSIPAGQGWTDDSITYIIK